MPLDDNSASVNDTSHPVPTTIEVVWKNGERQLIPGEIMRWSGVNGFVLQGWRPIYVNSEHLRLLDPKGYGTHRHAQWGMA